MKHDKEILKKVEETLESLDGLERAEASEFFYLKLNNRMNREVRSKWELIGNFLSKPAVFSFLLVAVILANVSAIYRANETEVVVTDRTPADYQSALASNYEIEIPEP